VYTAAVAGLTGAMPQLQARPVNLALAGGNDDIVRSVVDNIQPAVEAAVAQALRTLQASSQSTTSNNRVDAFDAERAQFEAEFAADEALRRQNAAVAAAAGSNQQQRAEYNFNYKVRDDESGTFIFQEERRDGDDVVGQYSYVNPEGTLITVNYQGGADGFSQTLDEQKNFVKTAAATSQTTASTSNSRESAGGSSVANFGASTTASNLASVNQADLISQIIAALQPQITRTVNIALRGIDGA